MLQGLKIFDINSLGWVSERFKEPVLKTGVRASVPWVRIPPHPPLLILLNHLKIMNNQIFGIGVDILSIQRIYNISRKEDFAKKILSHEEYIKYDSIQNYDIKMRFLAKKFCAKEAIAKSLGTGFGEIGFKDISILNNQKGAPIVILEKNKDKNILLSISDEKDYVISYAHCYIVSKNNIT